MCSQPSSSSTTGPSSGVSGNRSDILDSANLHSVPSQSPHSSLGSWTRSLSLDSSFGSHFQMQSIDLQLLTPVDDI